MRWYSDFAGEGLCAGSITHPSPITSMDLVLFLFLILHPPLFSFLDFEQASCNRSSLFHGFTTSAPPTALSTTSICSTHSLPDTAS